MRISAGAGLLRVAISSLLLGSAAARAATLTYGVDAGVGESDNVTLVPNNRVSQTIAATNADFAFTETTRRLDATANGNFSYLDYLQGAYGGQFIGHFDGLAKVALIPGRLIWDFQDSFGQAALDPFAAVTPTNQEHVNYFSTGPDLTLRLGPTGFVDLTAHYARTQYEISPFNSNRFSASVAVGRQLSANSSVSVDATTERALFDNTLLNVDFSRSSVYGHYELHGARTELTANLGITQVEQGGLSLSGPLAKLVLTRTISSAAKLTFTVGRDLTDASTDFNGLQSGAIGGLNGAPGAAAGSISTAPAAVTSENYTVTYGSVGWQYTRNRTTFGLTGRWEKDAYDGSPLLDLSRGDADFTVERRLTRALSGQLIGSVYRTQYAYTDYAETDGRIGGALTFREGRGLEIRLRYDHTSRIASGSGSGSGYQENRIFLTVGYRPRLATPEFAEPKPLTPQVISPRT